MARIATRHKLKQFLLKSKKVQETNYHFYSFPCLCFSESVDSTNNLFRNISQAIYLAYLNNMFSSVKSQ